MPLYGDWRHHTETGIDFEHVLHLIPDKNGGVRMDVVNSCYSCTICSSKLNENKCKLKMTQSEDQHLKLLKLLQAQPCVSQRDLAKKMGISLGKVNYCMRALIEKGLVKLECFRKAESKCKYAYLLTPVGIAEKMAITAKFLQRKQEEYESLKLEIELLRQEISDDIHEARCSS